MRIEAIATGNNPPEDVNVIIEVPVGGEPITEVTHPDPLNLRALTGHGKQRCDCRVTRCGGRAANQAEPIRADVQGDGAQPGKCLRQ